MLRANVGKLQKTQFRIKEASPSQNHVFTDEAGMDPDPQFATARACDSATGRQGEGASRDGDAPEKNAATMHSYDEGNEDRPKRS